MILSFARTSDAYERGLKRVSRRLWSDRHFEMWRKAWEDGRHVHQAWSNIPRVKSARPLNPSQFRLLCCPYREPLAALTDDELLLEGGLWRSRDEFVEQFGRDVSLSTVVCVIRFAPIWQQSEQLDLLELLETQSAR